MRKLLKNALLLLVFISGVLSCSLEEEYVEKTVQSQNAGRYKIEQKTFDDMVLDKKMSAIVKSYPRKAEIKNRMLSRTISSSDNGFYIDTEKSVYIKDTETAYESYTFLVMRAETEDENVLENLVLSFPDEGYYQLTLIRYELTAQEKENLKNDVYVDLSDNVVTQTSIEDTAFGSELSNKLLLIQEGDCFTLVETSCSYGNHADGYYSNGATCPGHHQEEIWTFCNDSGGGGGGGTPSGGDPGGDLPGDGGIGSPSGDGGGGGSGTPNQGDPNDPTGPGTGCKNCGGVVTSPVPPELEAEVLDNPCNKIKKILSEPNMQSEISSMSTKTSEANEWGRYKLTSSSVIQTPPSTSAGAVDFPNPSSGQYTMMAHTHNSPASSTYSIFSWGDLIGFATLIDKGKIDTTNFVTFLATADGTYYALTIEDPVAFKKFFFFSVLDSDYDAMKAKKKIDERDKYYNPKLIPSITPIIQEGNTDNLADEIAFLKFMQNNNLGATLLEANSDFTSFEKVKYNKKINNIERTPCN